MSSKKITRSGVNRVGTTSSGMSIDTIQQNILFMQDDITTIKENIAALQTQVQYYQNINISNNNRLLNLENDNMKLKTIIQQLLNVYY